MYIPLPRSFYVKNTLIIIVGGVGTERSIQESVNDRERGGRGSKPAAPLMTVIICQNIGRGSRG